MLDNYDSFTFNLVQYFSELGQTVETVRNDTIDIDGIAAAGPSRLVVSPGPCTPDQAGVSMQAINHFGQTLPVLGICLGHQCIGQVYGGRVVRAREIMHGKTSQIYHDGSGVFHNLPNPFTATRYHSLVVEKQSIPDCLQVTAWTCTGDGAIDEVMGLRHRTLAVEGVQFHPESILSEHGHDLLANFLRPAQTVA